jgi:CubicO group peptidase (beta-lactamase class C family)
VVVADSESVSMDGVGPRPVRASGKTGPMAWKQKDRGHGLDRALARLDEGLGQDHEGYQLYVSVNGETILDEAGGEARPGVAMQPSTITLWFSSGKTVTAVAIARLWEQGRLGLDDPVARYLPEFANGKERATIRHLLTHTGGFPYADDSLHPTEWSAMVRQICAAPAAWEPGTAAGYHGTSAHVILGELVRIIDGRTIERYAEDEIFEPLGMVDSYLALPPERLEELRRRLSLVWDRLPKDGPGAIPGLGFSQFNDDEYLCAVSPGNTCRGPAHDLGRLYEALLAGGSLAGHRVLFRTTVEAIIACHRRGMDDVTFSANGVAPHPVWGHAYPWGLGVALDGNGDVGSQNSRRVFGSSGAFSSVGFADPETGLACVIITNGLVDLARNQARLGETDDAVNLAVGD